MRPNRLVVFALLSLLFALSAPAQAGNFGEDTLIGTWEFDLLKVMSAQFQAQGQEMPPEMESMIEGSFMRVTFDEDGAFRFVSSMPMGENEQAGQWEVAKSDGNTLTVRTVDAEEKRQEVVITFTGEDQLEAVMTEQGQQVTLYATRVKAGNAGEKAGHE